MQCWATPWDSIHIKIICMVPHGVVARSSSLTISIFSKLSRVVCMFFKCLARFVSTESDNPLSVTHTPALECLFVITHLRSLCVKHEFTCLQMWWLELRVLNTQNYLFQLEPPMDDTEYWSYSRASIARSVLRACLVTLKYTNLNGKWPILISLQ